MLIMFILSVNIFEFLLLFQMFLVYCVFQLLDLYFHIYISGASQHLPGGFRGPNCVCRWVKIQKYICLVALLGKQLLEKQILKIILDICWWICINSCQYNTAWATLLFMSVTCFCCLLVPLKVTPHHVWVSCIIIELTINAKE